MFSFISWTNKVGQWERRRCSRRKAAFTNQLLAGRQFRRDPRQRLKGDPKCLLTVCWCCSASNSRCGEPGEPQGCLSKLHPPFLSPPQLSSLAKGPDGVQPREHAWRHCKSAVSTLLGDFERVSWTPTHTAWNPTERSPSLRMIHCSGTFHTSSAGSCSVSIHKLIPHPLLLLLKRHPEILPIGFPPHSALAWRRAVRVVLGKGVDLTRAL